MSFCLEDGIKDWLSFDNKIKQDSEKIKTLKQSRSNIQQQILVYAQENELSKATIKINDGKLKFIESRLAGALTLKYIKECLLDCMDNKDDVDNIMEHIKNKRPIKINQEIKRFYDEE